MLRRLPWSRLPARGSLRPLLGSWPRPMDPSARAEILFVYPRLHHPVDGIRFYAQHLVSALRRGGLAETRLHERVGLAGWFHLSASGDRKSCGVTVVVHYQPFSYARWGFAPLLLLALWRLRRGPCCDRLVVLVHEVFVTPRNRAQRLMRAWQRLQLRAILALADTILVTKQWSAGKMQDLTSKDILHLPAGSTLPLGKSSRSAQREALGLGEDDVVLTAFGTGLVTRSVPEVALCARAVADAGYRVSVFNLGAGTPPLDDLPPTIQLFEPGMLEAEELSAWLAASDIYLAPVSDGVSSGRTTVMAALQHGLPVVGTAGEATEPVLRDATEALILVPAGRPDLLAKAALSLASDFDRRVRMGKAAQEFYQSTFDWNIIAERLLSILCDAEHATP